jgi:hypothetical protein
MGADDNPLSLALSITIPVAVHTHKRVTVLANPKNLKSFICPAISYAEKNLPLVQILDAGYKYTGYKYNGNCTYDSIHH